MRGKFIGGILLIVGTSIGGGMLALPMATAAGGFIGALVMLFLGWMVMAAGAFLILEVNLWFPAGNNIISMAKQTLGRPGEIATWILYIGLLYALMSAYCSGGGDVIRGLLQHIDITIPQWLGACFFVLIFAGIVALGIRCVDLVNRGLMTIKFIFLFLLIFLSVPHVHFSFLTESHPKYWFSAATIIITSFGFSIIIPSLRGYFHDDVRLIRKIILLGTFIPFAAYVLWILVIIGSIPHEKLLLIKSATDPVTQLTHALSTELNSNWVKNIARTFTSICVMTSFLAVSLSLTDFLADGLGIVKKRKGALFIFAISFLPPLAIVIFYPKAFLLALSYAGIFCILLLVILPILMVWCGRYRKSIASGYQVFGGKWLLAVLMLISIAFIVCTQC